MIDSRERAEQIYAEAREHKRASAYHQRRLRERMAELRAFCDAHGVTFEFITQRTEAIGHGPERSDPH